MCKRRLLVLGTILSLSLGAVGCGTKTTIEKKEVGVSQEAISVGSSISFDGYKIIEVDGGDLSGNREPNVAVDIGFGDRECWAFTNEYGQLVRVVADEVVLQDDNTEPVTSDGRYYKDEAKVQGVERKDLDEGHIIADSLGGVSNAYNITPQDSTLNRHGDQAYMEDTIRDAGGCTDFEAIITYSDTITQIPSHYKYTYTIKGNTVTDEFDNVNPDGTTKDYSSDVSVEQKSYTYNEMVWVTETGKKYHKNNKCGGNSKQITKSEAESKGLEPCKKCY